MPSSVFLVKITLIFFSFNSFCSLSTICKFKSDSKIVPSLDVAPPSGSPWPASKIIVLFICIVFSFEIKLVLVIFLDWFGKLVLLKHNMKKTKVINIPVKTKSFNWNQN